MEIIRSTHALRSRITCAASVNPQASVHTKPGALGGQPGRKLVVKSISYRAGEPEARIESLDGTVQIIPIERGDPPLVAGSTATSGFALRKMGSRDGITVVAGVGSPEDAQLVAEAFNQ